MSSQAQKNPGQVANIASDCAEKHEEEENAVGNDDERGGEGGDQFGVGVGGELAAAAGSSGRRDRGPSLQPPMDIFKVASISQECMPHAVSLLRMSREFGKYHLLFDIYHLAFAWLRRTNTIHFTPHLKHKV